MGVVTYQLKSSSSSLLPSVSITQTFVSQAGVVSAEVVVLQDGTHELHGEVELFDGPSELHSLRSDEKSVKIQPHEIDKILIGYDQSLQGEDVEELRQELKDLGCQNKESRKYSIEPISVLLIAAGIFTIQGIANGFFSKLGEDAYEKLKQTLKKFFLKQSKKERDNLLQFQFFVKTSTNRVIEVNIVIENPSPQDLDGFFTYVPRMIDELLSSPHFDELDICRIVLDYKFTKLRLLYMLRSDSVPLTAYEIDDDRSA